MIYIGCFIIPLFTIVYASQASWMRENFTGIANHIGHPVFFILWTESCALYFLISSLRLFKKYHWHPYYLKPLGIFIYAAIALTPLIPYQDGYPHLASLHVFLAMGASLCFIFLLSLFFMYTRLFEPLFYQRYSQWLNVLIATLVVLLIWSGCVNSLLETVMVCGLSILLALANQSK